MAGSLGLLKLRVLVRDEAEEVEMGSIIGLGVPVYGLLTHPDDTGSLFQGFMWRSNMDMWKSMERQNS